MVDINDQALQARGLSPLDVVNAVNAQNLVLPGGTAKIGALEYNVNLNDSPTTVAALNNLPVKALPGGVIYLHDVAQVRDGFVPQTNIVRSDGSRAALLEMEKSGRCVDAGDRLASEGIAAVVLRQACPRRCRSSCYRTSRYSSRLRSAESCVRH